MRLLLGEARHDDAESHPQEVVNLEEAVQQEDDENRDAQERTQPHGAAKLTLMDLFPILALCGQN